VYALAFSPDGHLLASGGARNSLRLWGLDTGKGQALEGHTVMVSAVGFSPDGQTLASAAGNVFDSGFPGEASLWYAQTGNRRANLPHAWAVLCLAFAPDGKTLALGSGRKEVLFRDIVLNQWTRLGQSNGVRDVAFSPDGHRLAVATGWSVKVWDTAAWKLLLTLKGHQEIVWSVCFTPDGATLLSGSEDGTVRVWDGESGRQKAALDWKVGKVRAVAVAPDGMTAAVGGDGKVVLWDVDES
jgi:WD40 repeat protein